MLPTGNLNRLCFLFIFYCTFSFIIRILIHKLIFKNLMDRLNSNNSNSFVFDSFYNMCYLPVLRRNLHNKKPLPDQNFNINVNFDYPMLCNNLTTFFLCIFRNDIFINISFSYKNRNKNRTKNFSLLHIFLYYCNLTPVVNFSNLIKR